MAKKSFGTQLFQGFIRSAVNQVGRDGGRVISNQVYGSSHATPLRGVTKSEGGVAIAVEGISFREDVQKWHHKPNPVSYILLKFIGQFFLMTPYYIYLAIKYRSQTKEAVRSVEPKKVPDKRYRLGYRLEGYHVVATPYKRELEESEIKALRLRSNLLWISIGLFAAFMAYTWMG